MAVQEPFDPTTTGMSEYEKAMLGLQQQAQGDARAAQAAAQSMAAQQRSDALAAQAEQWSRDDRNYKYMVERQLVEDARADSKFQRSVADARAAGLSPLSVLGNMSGSGNVVSQASGINPVVPQNDATAMVNAYGLSVHNSEVMASLKSDYLKELKRADNAEQLQDTKYKYEQAMQQERLDAEFANVRAKLDSDQQIALDKIQADMQKHEADLALAREKMDVEQAYKIGESYEKAGYQVRYVNASSKKIADLNMHSMNRIKAATEINLKYAFKTSESRGSQTSVGASIPISPTSAVGGNLQDGSQSSYSEDPTKVFEERLKQARANYPIYVYSPRGERL